MKDFIKINENDNVIVAIKELKKGEKTSVDATEVEALEDIPAGHKMAIKDIKKDADVVKYGFRIGTAKEDIKAGQWIHTHNVKQHSVIYWNISMNRYILRGKKQKMQLSWAFKDRMEKLVSEMKSGLFLQSAV